MSPLSHRSCNDAAQSKASVLIHMRVLTLTWLDSTPCTVTSRSWPRLRRLALKLPAEPVTSSSECEPHPPPTIRIPWCHPSGLLSDLSCHTELKKLFPRKFFPKCTLPVRISRSHSSNPKLLKAMTPSSSVSPPVTGTSPPNGKLSGTKPVANGPLALTGAKWPGFSSQPPVSAEAKRAPPLRP